MAKLTPSVALDQIEAGEEIIPTDKNYKMYVGPKQDKCYFDEFTVEEKQRFIDLWNSKKLRIGYPYYFYVLPFFVNLMSPQGGEGGTPT